MGTATDPPGAEPPALPGAGNHPWRLETGAYLLGALDPSERRTFEEHLRTCVTCGQELTALAGLPGMLARVAERFT
jgi:anti-sigma factor RsiW